MEVAQLSIKLREVTAELEEVQFACSQHHIIPGSNASSTDHGGSSKAGETPEEHIYEEPPEEVRMYYYFAAADQMGLQIMQGAYPLQCSSSLDLQASFQYYFKKAIIILYMYLKLTFIIFQMQSIGDREDPIYDTVEEMHIGQPLASLENRPPKARR